MKRKPAIIKFAIVAALIAIGLVASFVSFSFTNPYGTSYNYKGFISAIPLGHDLKGGVYAVYESVESNPGDAEMNKTANQLTSFFTNKQYSGVTVVREGVIRIRVEIPADDTETNAAIKDEEELFELLGNPAQVEFVLSSDGQQDGEVILTGSDVAATAVTQDSEGKPAIALAFTAEGGTKFGDVTSASIGKYIIIYITKNGQRSIVSSAEIKQAIKGGTAMITGDYTEESAQTTADQIMSGAFAVQLKLLNWNRGSSSALGEHAFLASAIALGVGLLLAMLLLCYLYRYFGGAASVIILAYTVSMLLMLAIFPWIQLSLAGIAAVILSYIIMLEGAVAVLERLMEEYRVGKSLLAAYYAAFKKSRVAFINKHFILLIPAIMLAIFGMGIVSGFGIVLAIGLILSIFARILFRFILKWTIAIKGDAPQSYNLKRIEGFNEADAIPYEKKSKWEGA